MSDGQRQDSCAQNDRKATENRHYGASRGSQSRQIRRHTPKSAQITGLLEAPRCPELNPVENVWQFMRDNWLSNRIFKSYDDILEHCCFA